ncbi:MAG: hypothetical protein LBP43_07755, partial [Treponema sp.]|nr:hypothetical protein [Treponema sp.]
PHRHKEKITLAGDLPSPLNPPPGCVFHTRCPQAMPVCSRVKPVLKVPEGGKTGDGEHRVACHLYNLEDPYIQWADTLSR